MKMTRTRKQINRQVFRLKKEFKKTRGRPKNTECQNSGCKLKFDEYGHTPYLKKDRKFCASCYICHKGDHFPFSNIPGGANCHSECYRKRYGPIDNARAITSMARGRY
jgi:hypothetical protein